MTPHLLPTPPPQGPMSLGAVRAFHEAQPPHERLELMAGTSIMKAPPNKNHQDTSLTIGTALRQTQDRHRPDVVAATAMDTEFAGIVADNDRQPDIVVMPRADRASDRYAHQVVLLGEVVAKSDAATNDDKVALYRRMPTCRHGVVLSKDKVAGGVERRSDDRFTELPLEGPDAVLRRPDPGLTCRLLALSRDTDLLP